MADRYLKIVLTVIALELFWIGVKEHAAPVLAQQAPSATRVVITGVDIPPGATSRGGLPVLVRASDAALRVQADAPGRPLRIDAERPIRIETERPLGVTIDRPVKVEADKALPVEQVPYKPSQRPGE